jgi:glycosyltransferase involved in cell wall biosynthesis
MQVAEIAGAERHLLELLPSLLDRGWQIRFWGFTIHERSSFADALAAAGIPTHVERVARLRSLRVAAALRREIAATSPSIVHSHLFYADVQTQIALLGRRTPSVRTIHVTPPTVGVGIARWPFTIAGFLADKTIAVSGFAADEARRLHLSPSSRILAIPHGIRADRWCTTEAERERSREALGVSDHQIVVVCTSRLFAGKGHGTLIRAVAQARNEKIVLVIAGDGPERSALEALARRELPERSYRFCAFVSDVRELLAGSDIFVLPTDRTLGEAFGVSLLEAMAAGLPAVVSDLPALREVVGGSGSALMAEPDDASAFASRLTTLAEDPELRRRMGAIAATRARTLYGHDAMVAATENLYRDLLGHAASRAGSG